MAKHLPRALSRAAPCQSGLERRARFLLALVAAALAGCAVPPASQRTSSSPPPREGSFASLAQAADDLLERHRLGLRRGGQTDAAAGRALALGARQPARCLDRLMLRHRDAQGNERMRSVLALQALPSGTALVAHAGQTVPQDRAVREAWVDAHGVATLAYWNAPFDAGHTLGDLAQVVLDDGQLYDPARAFALRVVRSGSEVTRVQCRPGATVAAASIHADLTGAATQFTCEGGVEGAPGTRATRMYLHEYAHYLPQASYDERGALLSRFDVVEVDAAACRR